MKIQILLLTLFVLLFEGCSENRTETSLYQQLNGLPSIDGKTQYLASPFVTAGDRVYMVGYQDGTFPDLGWHIAGEMGGIWDHPIKLMDGFTARITVKGNTDPFCLDKADRFVNYPVGNKHHFTWDKEEVSIDRFQFVPDGLEGVVLEFRIVNKGTKDKGMVFSFTGITDLRPTWLGERTDMIDAGDEITFDKELSAVIAKDKSNPWYTAFGSSLEEAVYSETSTGCAPATRKGLGKEATLSFSFLLKSKEEKVIPVFIAGSSQSEEALRSNYRSIRAGGGGTSLQQKMVRYLKINQASHVTIPDKGVEQMYTWLKYNTDWLVRDVPGQGRGVSAGLPDYPWWFGADMSYTLQGLLATGAHDLARNSIVLLHNVSEKTNGNGRIVHEVSTNGSVYNAGNVNETAQYISALRNYVDWTGDKELIKELFPSVKKGIKWLLEEKDPDRNGYPNDSGMMEIPGLDSEMIDVVVYTQQALESAAEMASAIGDNQHAADYQDLAESLKRKINLDWWNPQEQSFGDFRGTTATAKPILDAALIRADTLQKQWAVAELKRTQRQLSKYPSNRKFANVVYHNWVVNTPMETGVADVDKGRLAMKTARKYENAFGVFVTGIDRTEEPDSVVLNSRKKIFSYLGAVMTLPTGVQAVAAARYGSAEDALGYLEKLRRSFSFALPGSMYEVSPDFGMVTQAWNLYGVAVPIVNYFFGIRPRAWAQTISISPDLPKAWKEASIENIKVGNNSLTLSISQKSDHREYHILQSQKDWTLIVDVKGAKRIVVNGKQMDLSGDSLSLSGGENTVLIY